MAGQQRYPTMSWHVYILRCADRTYYVGHTEALEARLAAHNGGRAAAYTAGRRPVTLVYSERLPSRNSAVDRERQIKRWSRRKKQALVNGEHQELKRLSKCRSV